MKKFISFIATSAVLLNSLVAPLSVLAQETPTPEPTAMPIESLLESSQALVETVEANTPSPEPTIIPEALPTPSDFTAPTEQPELLVGEVVLTETEPQVAESSAVLVVSEPQPVEKVYLSNSQGVADTLNSEWNININGDTAETKEPVKLGVRYIFPLENKVTLTFKSLPANESLRTTLKIAKIKVGDLGLPDELKPYGEYAYDITTGMGNGTFEYDLTLPKPDNQSVEIVYMENQSSTPTSLAGNQINQEGSTVRASDINHFTIFVVINPAPTGALCVLAGATTGTGCYSTIQAAIDASANGDEIEIQSDITVGQQVNVNKDVTIDGNGFTISPIFTKTNNSNNSTFGIYSSGVTIKNLTVDGTSGVDLHGINIYMVSNVLLDTVSVSNNDHAGIVVNGSIVTVNNIATAGNGWYGINIDQGSGVTTEAKLTINGTSSHDETYHILMDDKSKDVSVIDTEDQYVITNYPPSKLRTYNLDVSTSGNPSATLSQYANDAPTGWVNGNLGASKATYYEGDSIPYRMVMDNLSLTSHSLTIEWDTTKSSKHAEDYLTSFDRTVPTADPCIGVSGCSTSSTLPIPIDPQVSGAPVTQIAGDFRLYGGTITSVSAYSYADGAGFVGDKSARITITFTANVSNPVLAWGGHIADRHDWGTDNSAIAIPGSPYHMRLIDLDGSGGNQDRSLSADAVIFPASITIVKDAIPNSAQDFSFTTSGTELSGFSLDDDSDTTLSNTKAFSITSFASNNGDTKTITEDPQSGWSLTGLVCDDNNGSTNLETRTATLSVVEGENITCTFTNTQQNGTLRVNKTTVPNEAEVFSITATGSGTITGNATQNVTGGSFTDYTVTTGTYFVTETSKTGWDETGNTCTNVFVPAGGRGECTITNTKKGHIVVDKVTNPAGSGQSFVFTTTGIGYSGFSLTDSAAPNNQELVPGNYSVAETGVFGWDPTNTCVSSIQDTETAGSLELDPGETITCTFTNTQRGRIFGYKYEDANGDGQPGDWTPVVGWVIELWQNNSKVNQTQTTTSGYYEFTNLVLGSYEVREQTDSGWTNITPTVLPITLTAGEGDGPNNFVNFNLGQISGKKYEDLNGNGEDDIGEPDLGGWLIYIDANNNGQLDSGETSTSTGPSGNYAFSDLGPGTYRIREVNNGGWAQTDPTSADSSVGGQDDGSYVVSMTSNGNNTQRNFGNQMRGSITVTKSAIPKDTQDFGFTSPQLGNFVLDDDGEGSDGYKIFPNLQANSNGIAYTITENSTPGWKLTNISCTGDEDVQVNVNGRTVTLTLDKPSENVTCEFTNTKLGSISGFKYAEGSQTPLAGWTISLYQNGELLESQITTASGYKFDNLLPGAYSLSENLLSGWTQISIPSSVVITAGQDLTNQNFINFLNGRIEGYKWNDLNGNGVWEKQEEPPIEGWRIYLDRPRDADISVLTNASGHYYFGDLGPGSYRVHEEIQTGWTQTAPSTGEYMIDMTQNALGLDNPNYNFGNQRLPVVIKGYKVICENESDLPNWGNHGSTIDANTAQDYVDSNPGCYLSEDWDFQYGPAGAGGFGAFQTNTNSLGNPWNTFSVGSDAVISDLSSFGGRIETREVFPDSTYLPFSNTGDFSAEFYCSGDVYNYDNWEWINNPQYDQTYYCVAFNTLNPGHIVVDKVTDPEDDPQVFTFNPSWSGGSFTLTDQGEPVDSGPLAPGVYSVTELGQDGWIPTNSTCDNEDSAGLINLQPGETITCTFNNLKLDPAISITKINNSGSGVSAGATVTYTLTVTNNGNIDLSDIDITDVLPGGFSYVPGSTEGATTTDPTISPSGTILSWNNVGDLAADGGTLTISYKVKVSSDAANGIYTNFATCNSYYYDGRDEVQTSEPCNTANSTVSIGSVLSYGGNLHGQVLGISTSILPATGSPTIVLIVALTMLATGLFLNGFTKRDVIKVVTVKSRKKTKAGKATGKKRKQKHVKK